MNRLEQFETQMDKDKLRIPLDLAEWVDGNVMLAWVRGEIETLNWANPELQKQLQAHRDFRPKELLILMTYAYGRGILESEEIVLARTNNPDFKGLWAGPGPTAKEIERFRRQNRALLRWALVQILNRALISKAQLGDIRHLAGVREALREAASERLDLARHMDRAAQGA